MKIAFININANRHEGTSRAILEVAERLAVKHDVDLFARTTDEDVPQKLNWIRVPGPKRPEVADFASFKWSVDQRLQSSDYDIIHSTGPNTALADVYAIQTVHPVKMRETATGRAASSASWFRRLSWKTYDHQVVRAERQAYHADGPRGPKCFLPVSRGTMDELLAEYPGVVDREFNTINSLASMCVHSYQPPRVSLRVSGGIVQDSEPAGLRQAADGLHSGPAGLRQAADRVVDGAVDEMVGGESNVEVVPNGADLNLFSPANRPVHRTNVRQSLGLADDDFVLLFSGGDWRRKGLDLLLQALVSITSAKVKLIVVGHDRAGGDIRSLCNELGLDKRVYFAGFCKDVHRYYAAGDLFVFPTAYEAFSLASIEAAASGLPVLMPDVSGAYELLGSGNCGTIIRRDPQHITEVVMRYFQSPELIQRHSKAARELVEREFNWDVIARRTLEVYERLIERRER